MFGGQTQPTPPSADSPPDDAVEAALWAMQFTVPAAEAAAQSPEALDDMRQQFAHIDPDSPLLGDQLNLETLALAEQASACSVCAAKMPDPEGAKSWVRSDTGRWICASCATAGAA
jgi:hypothetical protein